MDMRDAYDICFLAVNGTVTVGSCKAKYDFTLVEYHLYIDDLTDPFSTLNNALELEFAAEFWILSTGTGKNDGFLEVPWIADRQAYDVAAPIWTSACPSLTTKPTP